MENWRNTLAEILRNSGGEAHLEEIYKNSFFIAIIVFTKNFIKFFTGAIRIEFNCSF